NAPGSRCHSRLHHGTEATGGRQVNTWARTAVESLARVRLAGRAARRVKTPGGGCDESLDVTRGVREPVVAGGDRRRRRYRRGSRGSGRGGWGPAALLWAGPPHLAARLHAGAV